MSIRLKDVNGRCVEATLTNALYVPSYPQNIFSVQAATSRGASVTFQPDHAELVNHDGTKFTVVNVVDCIFLVFVMVQLHVIVLTMHVMSVIGMKFWVIAIMTIF